jgi:3-hydroxybutyryl-CoA dehydrogenase
MKKQHPDTTHPLVAVMGDERLAAELTQVLEARSIEVLPANDERAIKSASSRLAAAFEVTVLSPDLKAERLKFLDAHVPPSVPVISSSVTVTALTQAQWISHPDRLVGFSGFPTLLGAPLVDLATTLHSSEESVRSARAFFASIGKETVCVQDRTGMIVPAIVSQIVNEALMAVQQNVASARDIDTAMKLGAGYPLGPIEWGETIGFAYVAAVLDAMRHETGEARFRTGSLLRQLAVAGKFWSEPPAPAPEPVQEELLLGEPGTDAPNDAAAEVPDETKKKRARKKPSAA